MSQSEEVVTVELAFEVKAKLDALCQSTKRNTSCLAAEAIALYVEERSWQINEIEKAPQIADSPQAKWIDGEDIETWLDSWES